MEISRNVNTQSIEHQSMSKAKLKKHLLSLTKEQITDIVLELYDARKEAKDYLEFYLAPNCNAELEKSKKAIRNEFFPTRGFSEYTLEFGDMWEQFYTTLERNFDKAMRFIFLNGLLACYYKRIEKLIDSVSDCGWGFYDTLQDTYSEYR